VRRAAGAEGPLAREWSLIAEWYPNERFWTNLILGYSKPGAALAASGVTNPFSYVNGGASPLGARPSFDVVVAVGARF
jgi:hypothetical protein